MLGETRRSGRALLHGAGCRGLRGSELLLSTSINPSGERGCRGGKGKHGGEGVLLPRLAPRKPLAGARGFTVTPNAPAPATSHTSNHDHTHLRRKQQIRK